MSHSVLKYSKALILYFILSMAIYLVSLSTLDKLLKNVDTSLLLTLYLSALCYLQCYKYKYSAKELGFTLQNWKKSAIIGAIVAIAFVLGGIWLKNQINDLCNGCINSLLLSDKEDSSFFSPEKRFKDFSPQRVILDGMSYFISCIAQEFNRAFIRVSLKNIYSSSFIAVFGSAGCLILFHMHLSFIVTIFVMLPHILWSLLQENQKSVLGSIVSHYIAGMSMIYLFV